MATPDNRSGFRLPWQSNTGSDGDASATAVVDVPAWPSHDLVRRKTDASSESMAPTSTGATMVDATMTDAAMADASMADASAAGTPAAEATPVAEAPAPNPASDVDATAAPSVAADTVDSISPDPTAMHAEAAPADPATYDVAPVDAAATRSDMPETATQALVEAPDHRSRKPTKFLADLTRAMRTAAEEAREGALAQFKADVDHHVDQARGACDDAAAEARRHADDDVAALGEWETAEIARIKAETEAGIVARQTRLEGELAEQTVRLDAELARVQRQVEAFELEMTGFFERLQHEEDPSRFATMAEQLPEPPAFEAWTASDADPEPTAVPIWSANSAADLMPDNDLLPAPEGFASHDAWVASGHDAATADGGMPAMQADDYAAAEAEAADWTASEETTAGATETEGPTDAEAVTEAEAEPTAEADADADGATPTDAAWPTPAARPTTVRTQVAVVGLVSVASIATFKRMLARLEGVHAVHVSSGPDGEFLFTVTHEDGVDMATAVKGVQGFEVEVVESGPGIVSCRTVDPEVV